MKNTKSIKKGCLFQGVESVRKFGCSRVFDVEGIAYSFDGEKEFVWLDNGMNALTDSDLYRVTFGGSQLVNLHTVNGVHVVSHDEKIEANESEMLAARLIVELLRREAFRYNQDRSTYAEFIRKGLYSTTVWIEQIESDRFLRNIVQSVSKQLNVSIESRLQLCLINGRKSYGTEITVRAINQ
jgi:hypothetical protein